VPSSVATQPGASAPIRGLLRGGLRTDGWGASAAAVELYGRALQAAPRRYKLCQMALRARADSLGRLGRKEEQRQDGVQNWLWGRGIRWPGHYILAYILGRRAFVPPDGPPSRKSRATGGPNAGTGARQRSRARPRAGVPGGGRNRPARPPRARASERSASGGGAALGPEILVVVALVAAYNYVLLTYGLDY